MCCTLLRTYTKTEKIHLFVALFLEHSQKQKNTHFCCTLLRTYILHKPRNAVKKWKDDLQISILSIVCKNVDLIRIFLTRSCNKWILLRILRNLKGFNIFLSCFPQGTSQFSILDLLQYLLVNKRIKNNYKTRFFVCWVILTFKNNDLQSFNIFLVKESLL